MAEKATRAELIAALVTDRYSGFEDGDTPMLEVASENRLEEFKAAADARKAQERERIQLEGKLTNAEARLKVAGEQLRAAEQSPTEEEWLAKAPPSIKTLLDAHKAEEDSIKASIVSQLKDLGAHTEAELKAKPLEELKVLAAYARVDVPDYSGRGVPRESGKNQNSNYNYAPPDPYAPGIKALQSKAVN